MGYNRAVAIKVFQYPKCSTCRTALKWLEAEGVVYDKVDIVAHPPTAAQLARAAKLAGVSPKKMFNTSGESYRNGDFKTKLATKTDADALAALAKDGKLIKRPLVLGADVALIGFKPDDWQRELARG